MPTDMQKSLSERKEKFMADKRKNIQFHSSLTSTEIMEKFLPKISSKNTEWYQQHCIGTDKVPERAVNGHPKGTPFFTSDKKIMRSGDSTWNVLKLKNI